MVSISLWYSLVEDSLLSEENTSFVKRLDMSEKRESIYQSENSFVIKRPNLSYSELVENESNLSLVISKYHPAERRSSHPVNSDINFSGESSILKDVQSFVDFNNISLSEITESSSITTVSPTQHPNPTNPPQPNENETPDETVNPTDMSYETLLRWEQSQGSVLDDKWKQIRQQVLEVWVTYETDE